MAIPQKSVVFNAREEVSSEGDQSTIELRLTDVIDDREIIIPSEPNEKTSKSYSNDNFTQSTSLLNNIGRPTHNFINKTSSPDFRGKPTYHPNNHNLPYSYSSPDISHHKLSPNHSPNYQLPDKSNSPIRYGTPPKLPSSNTITHSTLRMNPPIPQPFKGINSRTASPTYMLPRSITRNSSSPVYRSPHWPGSPLHDPNRSCTPPRHRPSLDQLSPCSASSCVIDLLTAMSHMTNGDWFLSWPHETTNPIRQYFWFDAANSLLCWGSSNKEMVGCVNLRECCNVLSSSSEDLTNSQTYFNIGCVFRSSTILMSTQTPEKYQNWFNGLCSLTSTARKINTGLGFIDEGEAKDLWNTFTKFVK